MNARLRHTISSTLSQLHLAITGPQILLYLPAVVIVGFWLGGRDMVVGMALGVPACLGILGIINFTRHRLIRRQDHPAAAYDRWALDAGLNVVLRRARRKSRKTGCMLIEIDDFDEILDRFGQAAAESVAVQTKDRLSTALRSDDTVFRLGKDRFGLAIAPVRRLDLEIGLQIAGRLQAAVEEPVTLGATTIYISACVGFGLDSDTGNGAGEEMANAAIAALNEARRHGPSSIRAYSANLPEVTACPGLMTQGLQSALENGQIRPWFQPQISTDTGRITGFEALARWAHPKLGILAPPEFLPGLEQAGKIERLGEVILFHALNAVRSWDTQGLDVPHVGVNFTSADLRNPRLPEKIGFELDRFDLTADRLSVEVLETVVATSPDDMISRNISRLSDMGCLIDLDDFGTGHASISSIRRFAIQRLKIDRSFVMKVDRDPAQQRMVSAIILMAEQLGLDTLGEGVETAGEHAMLAQLGCGHVQGFGIGRPMPFDKTADWMTNHLLKLTELPEISQVGN